MPRVRIGAARHKRHKRLLARAKGFVGGRSKLYKTAHETLLHGGNYRIGRPQTQKARIPGAVDHARVGGGRSPRACATRN